MTAALRLVNPAQAAAAYRTVGAVEPAGAPAAAAGGGFNAALQRAAAPSSPRRRRGPRTCG